MVVGLESPRLDEGDALERTHPSAFLVEKDADWRDFLDETIDFDTALRDHPLTACRRHAIPV